MNSKAIRRAIARAGLQKYTKLDPRRVADEVAAILDALAWEHPRPERAA
jgi:hypothetical protein